MNTLTQNQIELVVKFTQISILRKLFINEATEWKAVVIMQNELNEKTCPKYLHVLDRLKCNLVDATIEQRVQAFIDVFTKNF